MRILVSASSGMIISFTDDVATECLDHICRSSAKDMTLLYACVMEAQRAGNKRQAINALRKALDKYEHGATTGVHLPALLRSVSYPEKVCSFLHEQINYAYAAI